ncbi:MAG: hypothetical protein AAF696_12320 [Bacteroidota bacterium]
MKFRDLLKPTSKEGAFWKWFMKNEAQLFYGSHYEEEDEEIFLELSKRLKALDKNLVYAMSPIQHGDMKEFEVSADGLKESFPQVIKLMEVAPSHPHWKFSAFRQPNEGDSLSIKMGDIDIGYDDIFIRYLEEGTELHVELNIRSYEENGYFQNAVFILLDSLLGEYDVVMEIDVIDWEELDENRLDEFYPFIYLREIIGKRKSKGKN